MSSIYLAHLSDIHFGCPTYNLTQFLSKRWLGNLNFLFFRRKKFQSNHLCSLPKIFEELRVEKICFTGDFSTTSLPAEFQLAKKFTHLFPQSFFALPGNHDVYTKEAEHLKTFYSYFPSEEGELGFSLKNDRIFCTPIKQGWYWIALDCAIATPPFKAYGFFTDAMGEKLTEIFAFLPKDAHVIMGNHFPLFSSQRSSHDLKNSALLRQIVKKNHPKIKLYLHGHVHKSYIINKMHDGYPLVLNSGCSADLENGGFYFIKLDQAECYIEHYFFQEKQWYPEKKYSYQFNS